MRGVICLLIFTFATGARPPGYKHLDDFDFLIDSTILEIKEELPVGPFKFRDDFIYKTDRGYSYRNVVVDNWRTLKRFDDSELHEESGDDVQCLTYIELTDLSISADVTDQLLLHDNKHYHLGVIVKKVEARVAYVLKVNERPRLRGIYSTTVSGIEVEGQQMVSNDRVGEILKSIANDLVVEIFHVLLPKIDKGVDIPALNKLIPPLIFNK